MRFRLRCFLLHLTISLILALASVGVVFGFWYPSPLHEAVGAISIFLLLLSVDVIIGPLLTLILAVEGKKYLKFDFLIVALMQMCAFIYGMHVVAEGRVVWMVFNVDRFDLVQAYQVNESYREKALPEYQVLSWSGPKLVSAQLPKGSIEHTELLFESVKGGVDLPQRPDLYAAYENEKENVTNVAHPLAELRKYNTPERINEELEKWPEADAFLPLMSRTEAMVVLINKSSANVIAVVQLSPW